MNHYVKKIFVFILFANFFACATAYDKHGIYHKVRRGESVWKIAKYYRVPVQELAEWNNLQSPEEVTEGLKLYIPKSKSYKSHLKEDPTKKEDVAYDAPIQFDHGKFSWPLNNKLLSPFGIRNGRRHDGIDIKGENGDPIKAAAGGEVVFDGRLRGYGNMVILRHKDKFFTIYAHNSKNAVKKGQTVAKGTIVGYVGATGRATGPHLHFEIREGDKARNPAFLLPAEGPSETAVANMEKPKKENNENPKEEKVFTKREEMMQKLKDKKTGKNGKK